MTNTFLQEINAALRSKEGLPATLALTLLELKCDSGTIHLLGDDGDLHLAAGGDELPEQVLAVIRTIAVGKGMAGLAVERGEPVTTCNVQTDDSGDVRPGARLTGLQGAIVVPILREHEAVGALGVANREPRDFTATETALLLDVGRLIAAGL